MIKYIEEIDVQFLTEWYDGAERRVEFTLTMKNLKRMRDIW